MFLLCQLKNFDRCVIFIGDNLYLEYDRGGKWWENHTIILKAFVGSSTCPCTHNSLARTNHTAQLDGNGAGEHNLPTGTHKWLRPINIIRHKYLIKISKLTWTKFKYLFIFLQKICSSLILPISPNDITTYLLNSARDLGENSNCFLCFCHPSSNLTDCTDMPEVQATLTAITQASNTVPFLLD